MKKTTLSIFLIGIQLLFICGLVNAQAPKKMNYQGAARDAQGNILAKANVTLRLHIISGDDINTPLYSEEQTTETNAFGLFSLKIGEGQVLSGSLDDVDWGSAEHFIAVEMDANNSGHFEPMGVSQLLSVPYAFYAERSGTAKEIENGDEYRAIDFGGTAGQTINHNGADWQASSLLFNDGTNIGINTTSPSEQLEVDGNVNITTGNELKVNGFRAVAAPGTQNLALGHQAGDAITTGQRNMLLGWQAGKANTEGSNNAIIGYRAGTSNTTGSSNNIIGNLAGFSNTTGQNNIFYGYRAGYTNTIGISNFFAGTNAGHNNLDGDDNVALGTNAGFSSSTGNDNAFIGRSAGYNNSSGSSNTFVGKEAGDSNTSGSSNTYIGSGADGSATLTNSTAIGAGASVTQSNSVILGSSANVGMGNTAPTQKLHVTGNARVTGAYYDSNNEAGTSGQVLSSTGTGTDWIDASSGSSVFKTFDVGANGASDYTIDSGSDYVSGSNLDPTLYLVRGATYVFDCTSAGGHPFRISSSGSWPGTQFNTGVTNQDTNGGTLTFTVPMDAPSTLYYICTFHPSMIGTIVVVN